MIKKGLVKNAYLVDCRKLFILSIVAILLLCSAASAATVRYYMNTVNGVAIGVDGPTNVQTGVYVAIPPIITASMDTIGTDAGNARAGSTNTHPTGLYTHSRWYFTSDYSQSTQISANPSGSAYLRGSATSESAIVRLYDYDPVSGTKTLIGSSSTITLTGGGTTTAYTYTISSSLYTVPQNHRLMLQYDFNQASTTAIARVYASSTSAYIEVVETAVGGGTPTYNLSGYITNKSNGTGLNLATVQINTTPTPTTATTNSTGYYNFSGLSNGTYLINASLTGFAINSTTTSITGADKPNINISLSPIPTYLLSGYVTNASNGAVISVATVTINTTALPTTTNGAGYYSFTVSNGSYLLTASKTGYNDNSIIKTVSGPVVGNSNISLTPVPPAPPQSGGKILVATNRFEINDDWTTASSAGAGFFVPTVTHTANSWTGKNTQINATALFIDDSGSPLIGRIVTFNLYDPSGAEYTAARINTTTNANGLASFSFDMDSRAYYGNWTVKASNSSLNDSTRFIYNWWGCGISGCSSGHTGRNPSGTLTQNSPYYSGRENPSWGDHGSALCTDCHQSFDGKGGALTTGGTGHTMYTQDVHRTIACDNSNCHQSNSVHGSTGAVIGSCYSAACHRPLGTNANRSDITNKSTLSGVLSIYSNNNGSNAAFHTPSSTVPCFTCHGPMHNITKPDDSQRFIKNTDTESSHCTTCHTTYNRHNNGVNCTVCHSDDVHAIKVFAQNASYVTLNHNSPNPARGNCTNCHQNATFLALLTNTTRNPKAGSYTGNAPQIQLPLNHSSDRSGTKWGSFWTTPASACVYCHGSTQHETAALGTVTTALGSDSVGASIGSGTLCSSCHNPTDSNYNVVMQLSPVPPANIPGTNYPSGGTDHTGYVTDAQCNTCHGSNLKTGDTMSNFSHNVAPSSGGTCIDCHSTAVDTTNFGVHKNVNNTDGGLNNSDCEICHFDTSGMGSGYVAQQGINVYSCTQCHTGAGQFGAPLVGEHTQIGKEVITVIATCNTCHDNSGMYLPNSGANGTSTAISHYIKDVTNRATSPYQHNGTINTSNCITCHRNATYSGNASWGTPVNISTSSKRIHTETLTSQCDVCHKDGNISTLASVDFHNASVKLGDSTDCISCHTVATGIYAAINLSSFTKHRNVNATDGTNNLTNSDCKTCHTNITDMMTTGFTVTTKTCADCHNKSGIYAAPTISNHRQNGTNVSTPASCSTCHNNSINTSFAYSPDASSGHYGTRTNLISTKDCNNCHKNTTNSATWGTAQNQSINSTFPHSISTTPKEDCYACHNNISTSDFHNVSLAKPALSTVNCIDCHTTNRTMAPKEIDSSVFSAGVHKNRTCENCHANATDTNMINYLISNDPAKNCTNCHTGSGQYIAPLVAEHNAFGQQVITGAACTTCHSNGGMYLANSGTNGTGSAITHYIKDVTNLATSPYQHNGTIDTSNCILCHNGAYTNNSSWGSPVNISTSSKRIHNETLTSQCDGCHKDGNVTSLALVDFHNASVQPASTENCLGCHDIGGSSLRIVDSTSIGMHRNVNNTDGGITNADCKTCHFNISGMSTGYEAQPGVNVRVCNDCHVNQNVTSPVVGEHYLGADVNVTTMGCENCHSNSLNIPDPASTVNTTIGNVTHYGTTTNLVKPTAGTYNTACNICHNSATNKTLYGVQNKQVTLGHTSAATCDECHVNSSSSADTLHNISLEMPAPATRYCLACHTTYADKYGAPNIIGTGMAGFTTCNGGSCHGNDISDSLDTLARHNVSRTFAGTGGSTDTVYLNNQVSLTVTKGAIVNITSRVNDALKYGGASRIGGAEYYIDVDPGQGKGTAMVAADGYYDALQNNWENVTATLDTSSLAGGTYVINVRGMDIGKQWSATMNATLIVQAFGYINGTVTNGTGALVSGVYVYVPTTGANFTTGSDGNYSLMVTDGTYTVNASKKPEFYDFTVAGKIVTPLNTTTVDIPMNQKPTGTISGAVRIV